MSDEQITEFEQRLRAVLGQLLTKYAARVLRWLALVTFGGEVEAGKPVTISEASIEIWS